MKYMFEIFFWAHFLGTFSEVMEIMYIFEIIFWPVFLFLSVFCWVFVGFLLQEIKWGECHVCLLDGELFAGELPPGASAKFKDRDWQKICLNCLPHLEKLMAEERNEIEVFTGGFGVPPPEYYEEPEEPWMDEFGFDEAGNYIAGGWNLSDADGGDWDGGYWDEYYEESEEPWMSEFGFDGGLG